MYQITSESGLTRNALAIVALMIGCFIAVALTGCGTTSADRMQAMESGIDRGVEMVKDLDTQIPRIQTRITDLKIATESSDLGIAAKANELLASAESTLEMLLGKKSDALAMIEATRAELEWINAQAEVDWTDELKVVGEGMTASAPFWGAHGWMATLLGGLLGVPALIFARNKKKQASVLNGALAEVVRGASSVIADSSEPYKVKRKLKEHQSPLTRTLVDQLRPTTA